MGGILLLPKGAADAIHAVADVNATLAALWPGVSVVSSNDAWQTLQYLHGGKYETYINEVVNGRNADQDWRFSFACCRSVRIGKGSADIITKNLANRKPCYFVRDGLVCVIRSVITLPTGGWASGFAVVGDGIPSVEDEDEANESF